MDDTSENEACWICLDSGEAGDMLIQPCSCPRHVHSKCLARWQLQSAGTKEETRCRFCDQVLPDWRPNITPEHLRPAVPVMSIHFNNNTYWLEVHPGPDGLRRFQSEVRQLLGLKDNQEFDITFECKVPGTAGSRCELKGLNAFDAAVYCASITAAERTKGEETRKNQSPHNPSGRHDVSRTHSRASSSDSGDGISADANETSGPSSKPSFRSFADRLLSGMCFGGRRDTLVDVQF